MARHKHRLLFYKYENGCGGYCGDDANANDYDYDDDEVDAIKATLHVQTKQKNKKITKSQIERDERDGRMREKTSS